MARRTAWLLLLAVVLLSGQSGAAAGAEQEADDDDGSERAFHQRRRDWRILTRRIPELQLRLAQRPREQLGDSIRSPKRGIVVVGGGPTAHFANIYVNLKLLRDELGSTLPVELVYYGELMHSG
jgi:hypothetical protein